MVRSFLVAAALALVGCGGEDEPCDAKAGGAAPVCEPGKVEACACPDGTTGAQACDADGASWGTCECSSATGSAGSGNQPVRPYVYYGKDTCGPFIGTEEHCAELFGRVFFSLPRSNCIEPEDGVIVDCEKLSEVLWCCSS